MIDHDGEPWLVAADVCGVLTIANPRDALARLDPDEKGVGTTDTLGGMQRMAIISEAGVYTLAMTSRKPQAKPFVRWLSHEVIPSIRKRGGYLTPEAIEKTLTDPDFIIRLATELKAERAARLELAAQAKADAPKVLFADSVSVSHTTILVGELAKILRGNGVEIGQNRLFKVLRQRGYLISRNGSDRNMPTQRAMDLGLFEIKETAITHSDGHVSVSKTPKVTGKGQVYFVNRFLSGHLGQISEQEVAA
ncbi:phage antirepressor [Propionibacterium freudenreichii]|uniref:phage antirepressor n=1 Tax=Propionibacterium freudenreichii TaxID=1744 RepID=UPI0038525631